LMVSIDHLDRRTKAYLSQLRLRPTCWNALSNDIVEALASMFGKDADDIERVRHFMHDKGVDSTERSHIYLLLDGAHKRAKALEPSSTDAALDQLYPTLRRNLFKDVAQRMAQATRHSKQ
jgi:hypothetical protein